MELQWFRRHVNSSVTVSRNLARRWIVVVVRLQLDQRERWDLGVHIDRGLIRSRGNRSANITCLVHEADTEAG